MRLKVWERNAERSDTSRWMMKMVGWWPLASGSFRGNVNYVTLGQEPFTPFRYWVHTYIRTLTRCFVLLWWTIFVVSSFKGSEAETIVYVLGDGTGQNWQHVYTAVTRGQKRVYVVGKEADIERAIRKMIIPRKTRLCNLVKKVVSQPGPEGEDTLTQSGLGQSPANTQHFGPSQISGIEPTQSTPVLHTPSFSQPSCSTKPSCVRHLYKNIEEPDTSLQDDMMFSQTYSWSPMYICDEPSTSAMEFVSKLSYHDGDEALMGTVSSSPGDCSRPSKRPGEAEDCATPSKLSKVKVLLHKQICKTFLNVHTGIVWYGCITFKNSRFSKLLQTTLH